MRMITSLVLIVVSQSAFAQQVGSALTRMRGFETIQGLNERGVRINEPLFGIPLPLPGTVGDAYLDPHFRVSKVILFEKDQELEGYRMRYDLLRNELEFRSAAGVRVLPGRSVRSFALLDSVSSRTRYYVNAVSVKGTAPLEGFLEILTDGKAVLLKYTRGVLKPSDYRPEVDMGHRDNRIIKSDTYYVLFDGHLIRADRKKTFFREFGQHGPELERYARERGLKLSKEEDLINLLGYFNSL